MRFVVVCFAMLVVFICQPFQAEASEFRPVVVYHWSIEGNPYNLSIHRGVERFYEKTGIRCDEIVIKSNMDGYTGEIEKLAKSGHSPIVLPYGSHYPDLIKLARKFPHIRIILFDAVRDEPNIHSFIISDYEGAFLAGALAAMKTQSRILGFVSVTDIDVTRRFLCGYVQGAYHVSPEVKVLSAFTGDYPRSWFDGNATAAKANMLMDRGADIIFQVAGGAGPAALEAVAKRGRLGIGVDVNQNGLFPGHVLTSVLKRTDRAVFAALMLAKRDVWRDNLKRLGLAQDAVSIVFDEHNESLVTQEMRDRIARIEQDIKVGRIVVREPKDSNLCRD